MGRRVLACALLLGGCGFSTKLGGGDAQTPPGDDADVDAQIVWRGCSSAS